MQEIKPTTLCILLREGEVCLAMKKRGFGAGHWNGVGGKLQEKESVEEAALREMHEEIDVQSKKENLNKVGEIRFIFPEKQEWSQEMHVFFVDKWDGEPKESEEMLPRWFKHENIPFDSMWPDDKHWIPMVLDGKKVRGQCIFSNTNEMLEYNFEEVKKL